MIPNPILKVLSLIQKHHMQGLLMGGQACVLYGAAEFSRDADFALLASPANLNRVGKVIAELGAQVIAVSPFETKYLKRDHVIHFRCWHPEVLRLPVDLMSKMRGVDSFAQLWKRRTSVDFPGRTRAEVMSLPDLVQAKKTQRDKDWPMIRRLMEAHYYEHHNKATLARVKFWLRELRTPELRVEVVSDYPKEAASARRSRPVLAFASREQLGQLEEALRQEEHREREKDRKYWTPLKAELQSLRHTRSKP